MVHYVQILGLNRTGWQGYGEDLPREAGHKGRKNRVHDLIRGSLKTQVLIMDKQLLDILVCPKCNGALEYRFDEQLLICHSDRLAFPIRQNIPVLLIDQAETLALKDQAPGENHQ